MPLIWISLSFLLGLIAATALPISWGFIGLIALLALLYWLLQVLPLSFVNRLPLLSKFRIEEKIFFTPQTHTDPRPNYPKQVLFPTMLFMFSLAVAIATLRLPNGQPDQLATYNDIDERVRVLGVIDSLPHQTENATTFFVSAEEICQLQQHCADVKGRVYVVLRKTTAYAYGDQVMLYGKLQSPQNEADFAEQTYLQSKQSYSKLTFPQLYLEQKNQGNPLKAALYRLRQAGVQRVLELFPQPESSLLAGILFGDEDHIPAQIETSFRNTSTSHIIVISGFNITIVAALCLRLFKHFLTRWQSTFATLLVLVAYTILVGGDAAVSRAAVMGAMGLIGRLFGRRQTGINSLLITAAVLCIPNPFLFYDIGFQLSFIATLGLILFSDPITTFFETRFTKQPASPTPNSFWHSLLTEYLSPLLAAQLAVTPLLLYYFQQFSLTSIPANLLIAPLQPPIMIFGAFAVLASFILFPLGKLLSFVAWAFTTLTIRIVVAFDALPLHVFQFSQIQFSTIILLYLLLIGGFFALRSKKINWQQLTPPLISTALALITLLLWQINFTNPDGNLHIHFLDVDIGDALLIQTPHGNQVLINGGKSEVLLSNALYPHLPITQHQLDALVVANLQNNQIQSLSEFIPTNHPQQLLFGMPQNTSNAETILSTASQHAIPIAFPQTNQPLWLDHGLSLTFLDQTEQGSTLLLSYQKLHLAICLQEHQSCARTLQQAAVSAHVIYLGEQESFDPTLFEKESIIRIINHPPIETHSPSWLSIQQTHQLELLSDGNKLWFLSQ